MNFSEPFIRRPVMTTVLTVSVVLFGILSYLRLPVNDLPAVDYPVIQVQVSYPGASPDTVANAIATPLERQFMQINGLELITSKSSQGNASMTLQFALDKSIDAAATDVQTAISRATGSLPVDLPSPPTFSKTNPNDQPIMYVALTSDSVTPGQLYDYGSTQVGPAHQHSARREPVSAYSAQNRRSGSRPILPPCGLAASPSMIWPRRSRTARARWVRDSSTTRRAPCCFGHRANWTMPKTTAILSSAPRTARRFICGMSLRWSIRFRMSGSTCGSGCAAIRRHWPPSSSRSIRQAGANAVEVAQSVRDLLPMISTELPGSVRVTPIYDRSQTIIHSVIDVQLTLAIAFVLVVLVIFIFLGRAKDTLIPAMALPLFSADHVHSDGDVGIQPGQPFADGTYSGHRLPGGRRHRVS